MAIEVGTSEPTCFTIGDTVSWIRTEEDYPAPTWHLLYGFSGPLRFTITSTTYTTSHLVTMPVSGVLPGDYIWTAKASDGTSAITIAKGNMRAQPDLAILDEELDAAEERLAAVESAYTDLTSGSGYTSVSVDGVAFSRGQGTADLKEILMFCRREVERLRANRRMLLGGASGQLHLTHFLIR